MTKLIKDTIIVLGLWCLIWMIVIGMSITHPAYIALVGWWGGVLALFIIREVQDD